MTTYDFLFSLTKLFTHEGRRINVPVYTYAGESLPHATDERLPQEEQKELDDLIAVFERRVTQRVAQGVSEKERQGISRDRYYYRAFESDEDSTVAMSHTLDRYSGIFVNRKLLRNLAHLRTVLEERGLNGNIDPDRLPSILQKFPEVNILRAFQFALAFHEIDGHHWYDRDQGTTSFSNGVAGEERAQTMRGDKNFGDLNIAVYRLCLQMFGLSTVGVDEGIYARRFESYGSRILAIERALLELLSERGVQDLPERVSPLASPRSHEEIERVNRGWGFARDAGFPNGAPGEPSEMDIESILKLIPTEAFQRAEQAPRRMIFGGNWKMAVGDEAAARKLILEIAAQAPKNNTELFVAPSFVHLPAVASALRYLEQSGLLAKGRIVLAAQDVSSQHPGAHTGEISYEQLHSMGVRCVILGHSERRRSAWIHESSEIVNAKVKLALKHGLIPIVCLGETLDERDEDRTLEVIHHQLSASLQGLTADRMRQVVIAYEPVWAIGTGKTATPDQANKMHQFIRAWLLQMYGEAVAAQTPILYGGSMKPDNAARLLSEFNVDGGLIGGAALDAPQFVKVVQGASVKGFVESPVVSKTTPPGARRYVVERTATLEFERREEWGFAGPDDEEPDEWTVARKSLQFLRGASEMRADGVTPAGEYRRVEKRYQDFGRAVAKVVRKRLMTVENEGDSIHLGHLIMRFTDGSEVSLSHFGSQIPSIVLGAKDQTEAGANALLAAAKEAFQQRIEAQQMWRRIENAVLKRLNGGFGFNAGRIKRGTADEYHASYEALVKQWDDYLSAIRQRSGIDDYNELVSFVIGEELRTEMESASASRKIPVIGVTFGSALTNEKLLEQIAMGWLLTGSLKDLPRTPIEGPLFEPVSPQYAVAVDSILTQLFDTFWKNIPMIAVGIITTAVPFQEMAHNIQAYGWRQGLWESLRHPWLTLSGRAIAPSRTDVLIAGPLNNLYGGVAFAIVALVVHPFTGGGAITIWLWAAAAGNLFWAATEPALSFLLGRGDIYKAFRQGSNHLFVRYGYFTSQAA